MNNILCQNILCLFFLIMRLLFNSFKILSKSFASDGAPELIKMQTGIIDASSSTIVTSNPIKCPFVVENPHSNLIYQGAL